MYKLFIYKALANQNGGLHGVIALLLWSPACTRFCRTPFVDRGLSKPDREVAAPAQRIVVLGPVGHLVFWFGELVAAVLAVVVGHLLFLSMKSIRIMPFQQNGGRLPIYATTPRDRLLSGSAVCDLMSTSCGFRHREACWLMPCNHKNKRLCFLLHYI